MIFNENIRIGKGWTLGTAFKAAKRWAKGYQEPHVIYRYPDGTYDTRALGKPSHLNWKYPVVTLIR